MENITFGELLNHLAFSLDGEYLEKTITIFGNEYKATFQSNYNGLGDEGTFLTIIIGNHEIVYGFPWYEPILFIIGEKRTKYLYKDMRNIRIGKFIGTSLAKSAKN
jgi:hypothetical protein